MKASKPKKVGQHAARLEFYVVIVLIFLGFVWVVNKNKAQPVQATVALANEDDIVFIPTPLRIVAKGERLDKVPLTRVKWPKSQLNNDYVKSLEGYEAYVATAALPANLPIPISAISKTGVEGNAVVDRIPQEMRAITVRVDDESAVEGWAQPGDFVDIIMLRQAKEAEIGIEAKVIAENVKILSAGKSVEPQSSTAPRSPATVTVLVDQEHALKVKAAANIGKLTFALRAGGDDTPTIAKRVDQRALLGNSRALLPQRPVYQGKATGPDGKTYVLSDQSQWLAAEK